MKKVISYFAGAREEFGKVTWPHRDDVSRFTFVTVVTIVVVAMFLWIVDSLLMRLITMVMG
jgi:preprotein translocase subunit SecE